MEEANQSVKDILAKADEAEKNKESHIAINLYKKALQNDNLLIPAYNSLMKIYRRNKNYTQELAIINKGIKAYEAYYKKHGPKHTKKITEISDKLNKAFGLTDKKGNKTYNPEPVGKWLLRKAIVEKKIEK